MDIRTFCRFASTTAFGALAIAAPAMAQSGATSGATSGQTAPTSTATPAARGPLTPVLAKVEPTAGRIRMHLGDTSPFWGDTTAFWGPADPLGADLTDFWGRLTPYKGMIRLHEGTITQMAGRIRLHWGDIGATAGRIRLHDGTGTTDYAKAIADYRTFVSQSKAFWGPHIQSQTGKSFEDGFANALLGKYGINLNDPASLSRLTADRREMFFLEWHDNLMQFSGADQVDHWMRAINWTPALTQQQGSGSRAVIGLVDFFVANDPDIKSKVIYSGGYSAYTGHGAGVASLILASHDGKGIMGIAPNARVAAYNPFDASHTASWADVTTGIQQVTKAGANIVNLSLGVPGWTFHSDWRGVFKTSAVDSVKDSTLYVIAAGNSGTVQTKNIEMNGAFDSTFLVVGALGVDGKIASFSNQPGWTCLTDGGQCKNTQRAGAGGDDDDDDENRFGKSDYLKESGYLMNRFLVAPGELILVADGKGGVTRVSGTSFSAPLVAGAIALIHDRWPWLKKYPRDVAKILLDSATDLGARGADPVYGRGLLNAERAQSVLDFDKLRFELWNGAARSSMTVSTLKRSGLQSVWADKDMFFAAFEKLDSGERDFLIPLSSRLFGKTRNGQYFQEFVYNHFVNWLRSDHDDDDDADFAHRSTLRVSFADAAEIDVMRRPDAWSFAMSGRMVAEHYSGGGVGRPTLFTATTVRSPSQDFSFSFGNGDGALNLAGRSGLYRSDDFSPYSGGANPVLGFASGGAHFGSSVALNKRVTVSVGITENRRELRDSLENADAFEDSVLVGTRGAYRANAYDIRVDYAPTDWLGLSASATRLDEEEAFLGVRSIAASDFGEGTHTDAATLQAQVSPGAGVAVFGSATLARTASKSESSLRIGDGGAIGSAFQLGVAKVGLLNASDRLRMTVKQPLTLERGTLDFTSVMVIDRETGEKGLVTQSVDLAGTSPRRALAEASYATRLMDGQAEFSLFGRGELRQLDEGTPRILAGGRFNLNF